MTLAGEATHCGEAHGFDHRKRTFDIVNGTQNGRAENTVPVKQQYKTTKSTG